MSSSESAPVNSAITATTSSMIPHIFQSQLTHVLPHKFQQRVPRLFHSHGFALLKRANYSVSSPMRCVKFKRIPCRTISQSQYSFPICKENLYRPSHCIYFVNSHEIHFCIGCQTIFFVDVERMKAGKSY